MNFQTARTLVAAICLCTAPRAQAQPQWAVIVAPHKNFDGSLEVFHNWTAFNVANPALSTGQNQSVRLTLRAKF